MTIGSLHKQFAEHALLRVSRKLRYLVYICVLSFLSSTQILGQENQVPVLRESPGVEPIGFQLQMKMGYNPFLFRDFFQGTSTTTALLDRVQNNIDRINRVYSNLGNYGNRKVVANFQYDNDIQYGTPVGVDLAFGKKSFSIELGFSFTTAAQTNMSYDLTVGSKTVRFSDTTISAYDDIHENADLDSTVVPDAYGLFPTNGETIRFSMHTRAEMLIVPVTVYFHFLTRDIYTLSLGTGISYYRGLMERTIFAEKLEKYDIDAFQAEAVGFHFVFKGAVQLFAQSYIFAEARFNFAVSNAVKDSRVTGAGTLDSLFHENAGSDWGGGETPESSGTSTASNPVPGRGVTRSEALDFTGLEYYVGVGTKL